MYLALVTSNSISTFNEYFIPIITGLAVALIPIFLKYLNKKFDQVTSTAAELAKTATQVQRHHKSNKKRLNKLDRELRVIKANQAKTPSEIKSSNNA